eukprot:2282028-Amphidinium_carterae.5
MSNPTRNVGQTQESGKVFGQRPKVDEDLGLHRKQLRWLFRDTQGTLQLLSVSRGTLDHRASSSTQAIQTLSSAEIDFLAMVRGASIGLGAAAMAKCAKLVRIEVAVSFSEEGFVEYAAGRPHPLIPFDSWASDEILRRNAHHIVTSHPGDIIDQRED